MSPWFSPPEMFGSLYGGIVGGAVGIACGVLGAAAGILAPRGKGRSFVLGGMIVLVTFGLINLCAGIVALLFGQPYSIWYPLTLVGFLLTVVLGFLFPTVRVAYIRAETRKADAAAMRNS